MIDSDKRAFGAWWVWIGLLIILSAVVVGGLRVFSVATERVIFEQSYQRSSAEEAKRNMIEAELAQINAMLTSTTLTAENRADLTAQRAGLLVQLGATK